MPAERAVIALRLLAPGHPGLQPLEALERQRQALAEILLEAQTVAGERMTEAQSPGVQKHALETDLLGQELIGLKVPVALVAGDRRAVARREKIPGRGAQRRGARRRGAGSSRSPRP